MQHKLDLLRQEGLFRELKPIEQKGALLEYRGDTYLNLSSNDYLGISGKSDWQKEFIHSLDTDRFLMSASSSRLLTGNAPCTEELEEYIGGLYGKSCLLYNSGYHANIGILPALTQKEDLILADKLVHASIIDGLKLCACERMRYKHNDYADLERLLKRAEGKYRSVFVVTESIFSMDGDCAELHTLIELKNKYNFVLYVDEAHAVGVRGEKGLGLVEEYGLIDRVDLIMCTLGKAVASEGAFVVCDKITREWLVNTSRSLIFTTATPPINILWTLFLMKKIPEMKEERESLNRTVRGFRERLSGFNLLGDTQIVPLLLGENEKSIRMAKRLQSAGIWAMPVRYPSVPKGKSRIRFSLTAALTDTQLDKIYETLLA